MNILLILADDLGWHDVSYHGSEIHTPVIDKLAYEGIRFEEFQCSSVCTPSRASLLTGCFAFRCGLQGVLWPWNTDGLDPNICVLSEILKKHQFINYMIGKWHLGNQKSFRPLQRGFDYHYGFYNGCLEYFNHKYYGIHDLYENEKPVYHDGHTTDLFTEKTLQCIRNHNKNNPFFIYLSYNAPHVPLQPSCCLDEYDFIQDPLRKAYAALVTHMDKSIGKIVDELSNSQILNDTLIWFISDNGGWVGTGANNTPLRGGKISPYQGGTRCINFLNYKPLNSGQIFSTPVHLVDVLPTILKLVNVPKSDSLDGGDIFQLTDSERLLISYYIPPDLFSARYGKWKIISQRNQKIELYDLESDPIESNNVATQNCKLVSGLIDAMQKYNSQCVPEVTKYYAPDGPPPGFVLPKNSGDLIEVPYLFMEQVPMHVLDAPDDTIGY